MKKNCRFCGKEFNALHSCNKFCSRYCANKFGWKKGYLKPKPKLGAYKSCLVCQKLFYVIPSRRDRKYCSQECVGIANSIKLTGNHFRWRGGNSHGYKTKLARNSLLESGRKISFCEICHSSKKLGIHHRNMIQMDNRPENLVVLCSSCHKKLHNHILNRFIVSPIFRKEFRRFVGKNYVNLTNEFIEKMKVEVKADG